MTAAQLPSFRRALLRWYDANRRDLPWRRDRDPYRVWVSEIMLQQTRVAAVLDHYGRFLRRFPTLQSLAAARESSVLALWSGLGYYHRARRMHQAAKVIARQRGGRLPQTAEEWSTLPGIGRYTAAAIASISFREPVAVVDGNVERVLQRLVGHENRRTQVSPTDGRTGGTERGWKRRAPVRPDPCPTDTALPAAGKRSREAAWQQAEALLDRQRPGDFNQAMMELGATICTPRAPQCLACPLNKFCESRGAERSHPQSPRKQKAVSYALVRKDSSILLAQRPPESSVMGGMWELPPLPDVTMNGNTPHLRLRHSITDTDYAVAVFAILPEEASLPAGVRWFTRAQCERLPLTGLTRKILRRLAMASAKATRGSINFQAGDCHG